MNRTGRRAQRSVERSSPSARRDIVRILTTSMAEDGPAIRAALEKAVAPDAVKSGYIVDALMNASAKWSLAIEQGDFDLAFKTTIAVLWLARALAHSEGKISERPAAQA